VLDRNAGAPLWVQFRDALRSQILQGDYPVGTKLPTRPSSASSSAFRASWCAKRWPTWCAAG
jgi:DNA-binding transcriptional regulator YhcF (GntR family)